MNHAHNIGNSLNEQMAQKAATEAMQRGSIYAQAVRESSLMDAEFEGCKKSIAELDATVKDLLARISPVCQPGGSGGGLDSKVSGDNQIQAAPSLVRSRLISLRGAIDNITRDIAAINYRIEI